MTFLDEASVYLGMGWCVYPAHHVDFSTGACSCGNLKCPCPGKHPIGRWTEYQNRLPTKREVQLWFSSLECNIGMVTGSISRIVVVDIDGEEGLEVADTLDLAPTLSARTGGGGTHLFYATDEPVEGRIRAFEGIDIRGDRGYVVLPPSLHKSGNHYAWNEVQALAPFDAKLFKRPEGRKSQDWGDGILEGVSQGVRSVSAARLAGRYFSLGLSLGEVWTLMTAWNERNFPPLETAELERTVTWVHRKHEEMASDPIQVETIEQLSSLLKEGVK